MHKDYIPKIQRSIIQRYLYPKTIKKMNFDAHLKNLSLIYNSQEKNKKKQFIEKNTEEEKQRKEENLYKLKRFENIPSRLKIDTEEWVLRELEKKRTHQRVKSFLSPSKNLNYISPYYDPENILSKRNYSSLFEKYYERKIKELRKKEKKEKQKIKFNSDSDIICKNTTESRNINLNSKIENYKTLNIKKKEEYIYKEKEDLPIDSGIILPKIKHNYLKRNIEIIKEIPKRYKSKEEGNIYTHKNYGKIPEYLKQFKLDEIKRKEYEKLLEEEATYPPGTKLISEEERIKTLNSLILTKKTLENIFEKMPITKRSKSIQDKKEELERKLIEIENEIDKFSKKKVFLKVE
jgi:hypothetical protein